MKRNKEQCFFCSQNIANIDYKETDLIGRYVSTQAKIIDPMHTGTCSKHQRALANAIKQSRFMALLPYVKR